MADTVDHQGGYMSNMDHPQYHHIRIKLPRNGVGDLSQNQRQPQL